MVHSYWKIPCMLLLLLLPAGCLRRELLEVEPGNYRSRGDKIFVGDTLPDFEVTDLEGQSHSGAGYRDNDSSTVVVLFDATCGDCGRAMFVLSNICRDLSDENVEFVGISRGNNRRDVAAMTDGLHIPFPMCPVEDRSVYNLFCLWYVPRVYIVDRQGVVRVIYIESIPDREELKKEIMSYIK